MLQHPRSSERNVPPPTLYSPVAYFAGVMEGIEKPSGWSRLAPTWALVALVALASWMGDAAGGYFFSGWAPVALVLAVLLLILAATGLLRGTQDVPGAVAVGAFASYAAWTFASILWSANKGAAWNGAGQTLLYLLAFWAAVSLFCSGASRRWVFAASVLGPASVAALTLHALPERHEDLLPYGRLLGTVGYSNGAAAFVLVPFWAAVYLAGSRRVHVLVRCASLASAALALEVAVLTQSRGAALAMVLSLPVYFALSGQRLSGLLALAPLAAVLMFAFPDLNAVYAAYAAGRDPAASLENAIPTVWLSVVLAGAYALVWGLVDRVWRPPEWAVRLAGGTALAVVALGLLVGAFAFVDRTGDPVAFAGERWEDFKANDSNKQEQSRYLSASGSGRYALWDAALEGFRKHPVAGVGAHNYEATYYRLRDAPALYARQPHSLPLEVLVERGLVGGALFYALLLTCFTAGLRARFGRLGSEGKAQVGAATAAVAYWFAHSSVEWFWQLPAVTFPAVVYLAMLAAPWRNSPRRDEESRASSRLARAAGVTVGVLALAAIVPLYASDLYLQRSYDATSAARALPLVERAQALNPVNPRLFTREAELAIETGDWERVERAYADAIRLNPDHYETYMFKADYHKRRGEANKALELYREAYSRNPQDPALRQEIANLD